MTRPANEPHTYHPHPDALAGSDPRADIDRLIDGNQDDAEPLHNRAQVAAHNYAPHFSDAVAMLLHAMLPTHRGKLPTAPSLGIRLYALLVLLQSRALRGRSIRSLSRDAKVTPAAISKHVVLIGDRLGIKASGQKSAEARDQMRSARKRSVAKVLSRVDMDSQSAGGGTA